MEQTKAAEILSQWFNLAEQKPWQVGVYKVPSRFGGPLEYFSYWCGIGFHGGFDTPQEAFNFRGGVIQKGYVRWRGLASKPKSLGNRRVTRYVVMDDIERKPVASFATKKAAENYEESMMVFSSIKKIRFRTPEVD